MNMKVLFVMNYWANLWRSGEETLMEELAKALQNQGVQVDFLSPFTSSFNYDIVHICGQRRYYYPLAKLIVEKNIPFVISPIYYPRTASQQTKKMVNARLFHHPRELYYLMKKAELVLPNTDAEANILNRIFGNLENKLHVLPVGVEDRFANADAELFRKEFGISEPFVLNVARIERRKNQHRLIQALQGTGLKLVIIGAIAEKKYFEETCRPADKDGLALYLNPIPHNSELLSSAYAACRVFALPSHMETPGIAAMEAGLAKAAVVITPIGGAFEYFGNHALYCDSDSIVNIRTKILAAWDTSPEQREQLRNHLLQKYTYTQITKQTIEYYQMVIKKHQKHH